MKKIIVGAGLFFLCVLIAVIVILVPNKQQEIDSEIQTLFNKWDQGEVVQEQGSVIMEELMNDLIEHPQTSTKAIENLSPHMKVFEMDHFKMIEYIENPQFYGTSGRGSYLIAMADGKVELIDSNGSMRIHEVVERDPYYYVYATDYRVSNITGIKIFRILMQEHTVQIQSLINQNEILPGFKFEEAFDVLYYNNGHIYFDSIRNNGAEVAIKAGEIDYLLRLGEDGLYKIVER